MTFLALMKDMTFQRLKKRTGTNTDDYHNKIKEIK